MEILDMQLHNPATFLDWDETHSEVLTESLLQMMDAVGVDSVVISPVGDDSWVESVTTRWPERFALDMLMTASPDYADRKHVHPEAPDTEDQIDEALNRPGFVAFRVVASNRFAPAERVRVLEGRYDNAFRICEDRQVPIFLFAAGNLELVPVLAQRFPTLQLIIDHLGIPQPPMDKPDTPKWAALNTVLTLSKFPNVAIKFCGVPSLSEEPYPYGDVWDHVMRLVEAYGIQRLAWASDIGRFRGRFGRKVRLPDEHFPGRHNYMESLALFLYTDRLSQTEKEWLLGRSARSLLRWPKSQSA